MKNKNKTEKSVNKNQPNTNLVFEASKLSELKQSGASKAKAYAGVAYLVR